MLKNEEIRQKHPFFGKGLIFLSWVNYVWLHLHSSQRRVKRLSRLCGFAYQKLISHSVTRWLSLFRSFPRMLQLYPASNSYFMSIDKPTVGLKRFCGNSLSEFCLTH